MLGKERVLVGCAEALRERNVLGELLQSFFTDQLG
jgi:hypothetical protein